MMSDEQIEESSGSESKKDKERREIKGGIPYSTSPGVLKKALDLIIPAERPDKFGSSYMTTILKLTGGSARAVPPFLKKIGFLSADGSPTDLYSKFKTDGGRSIAAFEGLNDAFNELFRRNEYIHKATEAEVKDILIEITGLKKNDPVIRMMYQSFDAVRAFISSDQDVVESSYKAEINEENKTAERVHVSESKVGLSYHINIVIPETENIAVLNAIFKSLKENILT